MSKKQLMVAGVVVLLLLAAGAGYYFWRGSNDVNLAGGATAANTDSVGPDDHVMGSANAPVTLIEYFAQACSVCAHFNQEVFPLLKAKYIDTGKVRYVMRLFPLFPVDGPSYKLDTCVPPDQFFSAADLLFRNQPQWDSAEFQGADAHSGLIRMARIMGMSEAQADACMNSTAKDAAINNVAKEGLARYPTLNNGTPTFVIDFKDTDIQDKSWDGMQKVLDAALAAKGKK
jgi:protein-disulfide isomerase